jgi:hypothetical protein
MFITIDGPTQTHYHQLNLIYIKIQSWQPHSMEFDKCIMTPYTIKRSQRIFSLPWKYCPTFSSLPIPGNLWSFYSLHSFAFPRISCSWIMYRFFSVWLLSLSNMHLNFLYCMAIGLLKETAKLSSKVAVLFCIPTSSEWKLLFFTFLSPFGVSYI